MAAEDEITRLEIVGAGQRTGDETPYSKPATAEDVGSTAAARRIPAGEFAALGTKLESAQGVSELADWLREVEQIVSAIEGTQVGETRSEIREVINKLLQINAEVQNVLRLKKLLS
jgi:hypothetical protein